MRDAHQYVNVRGKRKPSLGSPRAGASGIRGMLVHAIPEQAQAFYLRLGLTPSPLEPLTLMTTVAGLRSIRSGGIGMNQTFTAVVKQDGEWWIGWIEEVPGVNCQEGTREELLKTLRVTLAEALVESPAP